MKKLLLSLLSAIALGLPLVSEAQAPATQNAPVGQASPSNEGMSQLTDGKGKKAKKAKKKKHKKKSKKAKFQ